MEGILDNIKSEPLASSVQKSHCVDIDDTLPVSVGLELEVYAAGSDEDVVDMLEEDDADDDYDDGDADDDYDDGDADDDDDCITQVQVKRETDARAGQWSEGACQPPIPEFKGKPGPTIELPDDATPLDYLKEFITPDMMQLIVEETNRYASTYLGSATLASRSRYHKWTATSVEEIWAFFGIVTAMGILQVPDIDDYWSTDTLLSFPFFASTMKRDRFKLLLTFLHLNDNATQVPKSQDGHDPLHKLAPFLKCLEEKFQRNYYPKKNLTIDEAVVQWRGNLHFRVYLPNKLNKRGIKLYQLCDSDNSYCCGFEVHTDRNLSSLYGVPHDVVMRLIEPYLDKGHHLYLSSNCTSPILFEHLAARVTSACGTMRLNQIGVAPQMKAARVKTKGQEKSMTNGWLNHIKFYGRKEVNILTTMHTNEKMDSGKIDRATGKPIIQHKAVVDHNKHMRAVDRSDQMLQNSSFRRKTMKWWKKLFFHLLMLAELNTYLFYKAVITGKGKRPMEHKIFMRELAKEMASLMPTFRDVIARTTAQVGDSSIHRLTARHFPSKVISKRSVQRNPKRTPCRICVVCSNVGCKKRIPEAKRRRRESTFECAACDVGLCATPCFEMYHTLKDYKRASRRLREGTGVTETV